MAYTYEGFMADAAKAGMMDKLTQKDVEAARKDPNYGYSLLQLYQDQENAADETQRLLASEAANQLRSSYGTLETPAQHNAAGTGPYTAGGVQNAYGETLDQAAGTLGFTYDPEKDKNWSDYKKMYLREGQRAAEDTLAKASAATGGRPSSYAMGVAQQTDNYYRAQMADRLPALEAEAYDRFLQEYSLKQAQAQQDFENALTQYQVLGYATPEIEQILGIGTGQQTTAAVTGSTGVTGYNNGSLGPEEVKQLQGIFGVEQDGKWGPASTSAAGGMTADQAWTWYQQQAAQGTQTPSASQSQPGTTGAQIYGAESNNARSFRSNVMTPEAFAASGNKPAGSSVALTDYTAYLRWEISRQLNAGQLTDADAAFLINYYGL